MLPLGSEGGFHFRMIWDEELETEIGSNGTDGTVWVEKRQRSLPQLCDNSTSEFPFPRNKSRTRSNTGSHPQPREPDGTRAQRCSQGNTHRPIPLGTPSHSGRAKCHRHSITVTTSQKSAFHLQCNTNLVVLTCSVGLDVDDLTLRTVCPSFI